MGPIVLASISEQIHAMDGKIDCHLMVENPSKHFGAFAQAGADSVTFHYEAVRDVRGCVQAAREHDLDVGLAFNPGTPVAGGRRDGGERRRRALHEHRARVLGPGVPARLARADRADARSCCRRRCTCRSTAGSTRRTSARRTTRARRCSSPPARSSGERISRGPIAAWYKRWREPHGAGRSSSPSEGVGPRTRTPSSARSSSRREERSSARAGTSTRADRTRSSSRFARPADARRAQRSTRRSSRARGSAGPRRASTRSSARGSRRSSSGPTTRRRKGSSACASSSVEVEVLDLWEARRQNEAWRTWKTLERPFVTYKAAVTLDGRVTIPGSRWISGEESRRLVHELRAQSDAVGVGMGTVRADDPQLDARDVAAERQPRRIAFGLGPLPDGSELELRSGEPVEELRALAARRRAVAPARGRPDDRDRVPRACADRQAPALRRAEALGRGAARLQRLRGTASS